MADIIINGMEMPKNEPLLIKLNPDGSVSTTAKNGYRKYAAVPAADVEPVQHGRWIMGTGKNGLQTGYRECSRCGEIVKYGYSLYGVHNFCNYCGAKMDEEVNT